ncbi:MAG: metal ABC transporter ATP-binding protein [Alphaproteobacteria bacterium]
MSSGRPDTPPIKLSNLSVGYRGHPVLTGIDWIVDPGSMTALIGPNGGGKSTLLKTIAHELPPLAGRMEGNDRGAIAYLPQSNAFDLDFPISVHDVVAMGLWRRLGPFGKIGKHESAELVAAMSAVGIGGIEQRPIGTVSGGQLQRVLFARLMLLGASIILLDEPFAGIDEETIAALMALIENWQEEGRTVLAALHDLDQVRASFPLAMRLEGERAIAGATEEVLSSPLATRGSSGVGVPGTNQ